MTNGAAALFIRTAYQNAAIYFGDIPLDDARTNDVVHAELKRAVDNANKAVSKPESIRKFAVLTGDFTEDNGYLTPSLKLKRNLVLKDYASEVEALYAEPR